MATKLPFVFSMISLVSSTTRVSVTRSETVNSSAETTPVDNAINNAASAATTNENIFFIVVPSFSVSKHLLFFLNYSNFIFIISKKIKTKGGFCLDWITILTERVKEGI